MDSQPETPTKALKRGLWSQSFQNEFEAMSAKHDGKLSEKETEQLLLQKSIILNAQDLRIFFLEADTDLDGLISMEEFKTVVDKYQHTELVHSPPHQSQSILRHRALQTFFSEFSSTVKEKSLVFLGGSCNPTTWRKDIAMPNFEKSKISFYNPQVDDWHSGLVEIERVAKRDAVVLLFVIDDLTRAIASMLEAAEYIGSGRNVVFSVQYVELGVVIGDAQIGEMEQLELNFARRLISDIARQNGLEVYQSVEAAVIHIQKLFDPETKILVHKQQTEQSQPEDQFLFYIQSLFHTFDQDHNGSLDMRELYLLIQRLGFRASLIEVQKIFGKVDVDRNDRISFEEFLKFMNLLLEKSASQVEAPAGKSVQNETKMKPSTSQQKDITTTLSKIFSSYCDKMNESKFKPDVYLGGSTTSDWREKVAIPLLSQNRLSHFNPFINQSCAAFGQFESKTRDMCEVMLYVLNTDDRCISTIVEAAYYIGKKRKVVLVTNKIPSGQKIKGESISEGQLKDLNRGRTYLEDAARTAGCSIFSDVETAVRHIVSMRVDAAKS